MECYRRSRRVKGGGLLLLCQLCIIKMFGQLDALPFRTLDPCDLYPVLTIVAPYLHSISLGTVPPPHLLSAAFLP